MAWDSGYSELPFGPLPAVLRGIDFAILVLLISIFYFLDGDLSFPL